MCLFLYIDCLDSEKPVSNQDVSDPTGPAARKGVLVSFRTGKTMEIPEKDIVSDITSKKLYEFYSVNVTV